MIYDHAVMCSMVFFMVDNDTMQGEKGKLEANKMISKKIFWILTILGVIIAIAINAGIYFGMGQFWRYFTDRSDQILAKNMALIVQQFELIFQHFYTWVLPVVSGCVLVCAWILWLILKTSLNSSVQRIQTKNDPDKDSGKKKKDFIDQKIEQDRQQRLYLHTLSVFQREGRLLDFFDEDLKAYDDEQIGAAVRSIQEDCKKAVKKYINPKPVIDSEEGERVVVEKNFDIDAIKLIGNVSGEPPFEGILNHRGWKAGKREIPKLSDIQDSSIIVPAEVEIQ